MRHEKFILLVFGWIFIIFCFFPYINLTGLPTTTQPNALLLSIIPILFIRLKKLPKEIYLFGIVLLFASVVLFFSDLSFLAFRDWANYLSLVAITFGSYSFLSYINGLPYKFFCVVVIIWLFVGLVQMFAIPDFLSFLVTEMRGALSDGRGVTGLCTEPTYYGLITSLFFVVYLINGWHLRSKLLGVLILFQTFFLSRSSTVIVFFLLTIGLFILFLIIRFNVKIILGVTALSIITGIFITFTIDYYKELRIYEILEIVAESPEIILATDFSVSERVNHMVFPIVGLIEGGGVPRGFGNFGDYLTDKKNSGEYKVFFSHRYFRGSTRILSGHGKGFFELGGIGLLISIGLFSAFRYGLSDLAILFGFIFYYLLLFAALPFMTATVPFIAGNILYLRHQKRKISFGSKHHYSNV